MQKLHKSMGFSFHARAMRHLEIRLRSRPETTELAGDARQQRRELLEAREAWEQAREERICATVEVYYLDDVLDAEVIRLAREVVMLVDGDTGHPLYKMLFPAAPSTLVAPRGGPNQRRFVTTAIDSLDKEPTLAPVAHRGETLSACLDQLDQAVARRDELFIPENQAHNKLRIALDNTRRVFSTCYHRLNLIFPDKPNLVESYFLKFTTGNNTATSTAPAPTAAPAATDAVE